MMLKDKVAVVTGAARGIGREIALLLAKHGAKVVVNDYGGGSDGAGDARGPADDVVNEIKGQGGQAAASYDSVASMAGGQRIVQTALDHFGHVDIVVNNAGILRDRMIFNMTEEEWDGVIDTHLKGTFAVTRAAVPHMRERKWGRIINMTSTSGLVGNVGQANYAAAKLGIVGFTKVVALDMARYNVTANCISPFAWTRMIGTIPTETEAQKARVEKIKKMGARAHRPGGGLPRLRRGQGDLGAGLRRARQGGHAVQRTCGRCGASTTTSGWTPERLAEMFPGTLQAPPGRRSTPRVSSSTTTRWSEPGRGAERCPARHSRSAWPWRWPRRSRGRPPPPSPALLVTVGEVTDASAVVWVRGVSWGEVTVRYAPVIRAPDGAAGPPVSARGQIRVAPSHNLTGKLVLQPLEPATRYRYTITQNTAATSGEFVTAPAPTVAIPVRFAWSGDLGSRGHCRKPGGVFPIFRALAQVPADFFLFVGDTIYADHECGEPARVAGYDFVARRLADFWAKHLYNRQDPAGQAYFRSTSVYAIWDDHEVRNDFSGPTEPLTETGRRAFIDYFPIRPPREEPGRLYRSFRWGSLLEVFILDTRQYRSSNTDPDGPSKTMLGRRAAALADRRGVGRRPRCGRW